MKRAALILLPAIAALSAAAPHIAGAKSKAYCRQFAQGVADSSGAKGATVGATAGNVLTTVGQVLVGTVTVNQSMPAAGTRADATQAAATPAGAAGSDQRQQVYRRAYADCRAS